MSEALHPGLPQEGGLTALRPLAQDATAGSVPLVEETLMKAVFCVPLVESPWPKRRGQCGGQAQPVSLPNMQSCSLTDDATSSTIMPSRVCAAYCRRWSGSCTVPRGGCHGQVCNGTEAHLTLLVAVVGSVPYDRSDRRVSLVLDQP